MIPAGFLKPSHDVAVPVDPDGQGAYSARDIDRSKGEAEGFYRSDCKAENDRTQPGRRRDKGIF